MPRPSALPLPLTRGPFLVSTARDIGATPGRLRGADLSRPFRGVRAVDFDSTDLRQRCRALALRLDDGTFFSHATAARLMMLPLPAFAERDARLHVSVFDPMRPPQIAEVAAHHLAPVAQGIRSWNDLSLSSPVLTWCLLASQLGVPDLVAVADALLTGPQRLATIEQLSDAVHARPGRRGTARLARALPLVRAGPLSRPETFARLIFTAAGLPEPEINGKIFAGDGTFLAMSDLVFREHRVACEYEGNGHLTDVRQFRKDILRRERVEDAGWRLLRFTADDLRYRTEETVTRLALRLEVRVTAAGIARAKAVRAEFVL